MQHPKSDTSIRNKAVKPEQADANALLQRLIEAKGEAYAREMLRRILNKSERL